MPCTRLTGWSSSTDPPWPADAPVHLSQQALRDLERTTANVFDKRVDFPHFRKKGRSGRFCHPDPEPIRFPQANSRLLLPKLGWLHDK